MRLARQAKLLSLTGGEVFQDHVLPLGQLLIGVEQLNSVDAPVLGDIDVQFFAYLNRSYLSRFSPQLDVRDVVLRVITEFHRSILRSCVLDDHGDHEPVVSALTQPLPPSPPPHPAHRIRQPLMRQLTRIIHPRRQPIPFHPLQRSPSPSAAAKNGPCNRSHIAITRAYVPGVPAMLPRGNSSARITKHPAGNNPTNSSTGRASTSGNPTSSNGEITTTFPPRVGYAAAKKVST